MYILRIFSCFPFETSIAILSGVLEIKLRAWVGALFISDMAKSKRVGFLNRAKYCKRLISQLIHRMMLCLHCMHRLSQILFVLSIAIIC